MSKCWAKDKVTRYLFVLQFADHLSRSRGPLWSSEQTLGITDVEVQVKEMV